MQATTKKQVIETIALFGGIIAIFFEWLAVLLFYINFPTEFGGEKPISYFATLPQTRIIFVSCLSLAAISFWIFVRWHLKKRIETPVKVFALSMLFYFGTAVFPFELDNGMSENIHKLFAYLFGLTFILGIYLIGKNSIYKKLKFFSHAITVIVLLLNLLMFFAVDKTHILFFEVLAGFLCQIWTVGITYFTYKIKQ